MPVEMIGWVYSIDFDTFIPRVRKAWLGRESDVWCAMMPEYRRPEEWKPAAVEPVRGRSMPGTKGLPNKGWVASRAEILPAVIETLDSWSASLEEQGRKVPIVLTQAIARMKKGQ